MQPRISFSPRLAAIWLLALSSAVHAHTWVEELRLIASNGSYVGAPGYPRNYQSIGADPTHQWQVPPNGRATGTEILPTDLMCKDTQPGQVSGFPTLSAAPQDQIALRYLENGHVTLFTNQRGKPAGRGTIFIYGTKSPAATDTYLGIHRVWNTAGTGGDKRGKLLATRPFDDGRCFQNNNSPLAAERAAKFANYPTTTTSTGSVPQELPCQADVQLPEDAGTSGSYTLYWVWEWPTLWNNGAISTNESYTSCMDISMISTSTVPAAGPFDTSDIQGMDAASFAVEAELSTAIMINPLAPEQTTSDNLNTASTPPGVTAPPAVAVAESAAAAAATTTQAGSSSVSMFVPAAVPSSSLVTSTTTLAQASPTSPGSGFITVTVYAMETVTAEAQPTTSSTPHSTTVTLTKTATIVSVPASNPTSTVSGSSSAYLSQPAVGPSFSTIGSVGVSYAPSPTSAVPVPSPFINSAGNLLDPSGNLLNVTPSPDNTTSSSTSAGVFSVMGVASGSVSVSVSSATSTSASYCSSSTAKARRRRRARDLKQSST